MLELCLFGAGRIGAVHAENIARHPRARLRYVVDISAEARDRIASSSGAQPLDDPGKALADPLVSAVVIASPTNTHVDLVIAAARAKKAIFCEKPIDLDLERVDVACGEIERAGVRFFIGFNRRFDPSFAKLRGEIEAGVIGKVESVTIISRDPAPPPPSYLCSSGGIFRDMTIHDFDMARWLLGEEPASVFAAASCLVDPAIARAGDADTAMVLMTTPTGKLSVITNSRRAAYGYDQRIEVFGERGMLQAGNWRATTVTCHSSAGVSVDRPPRFFLERYQDAYRREMDHFITSVLDPTARLLIGPEDGRRALVLAEAAAESVRTRGPVSVS